MNRKERRAVSVKAENRELARQQKKAYENRRMLESIRRFLQKTQAALQLHLLPAWE